jgi:serine/threonine protein kinase
MSSSSARVIAGRYRLGRLLGRGGMGAVWQAHDTLLGRDVALKEVWLTATADEPAQPSDPQVRRVLREAQAAARLRHTGIVTVYDVVTDGGSPWIVMELVDGRSLAEVIAEQGLLTERRTAEIGLHVLDALRVAHREGIAHRDVKPANILLEEGRVVLTDFGIAAIDDATAITATGQMVGSPAYLAPERINGQPATAAADLWALGVTLYTAVTGKSPYQRDDALATMAAVLHSRPETPAHAGRLWPVIKGLLDKDPARRLGAEQARELLANVVRTAGDSAAPERRRRWWPVRQPRTEDTPDGLPGTLVAPSPTLAAPTAYQQGSEVQTVPTALPHPAPPTASTASAASTVPAASDARTAPIASAASTVPSASAASTAPTISAASTVPTASDASTTPTVSAAPTVSTASAASTASDVPTVSDAPTASAAPTVSDASTPSDASTVPVAEPQVSAGAEAATVASAESDAETVPVASGEPDAETVPAGAGGVSVSGPEARGVAVPETGMSPGPAFVMAPPLPVTPLPAYPEPLPGARRSRKATVWPVAAAVTAVLLAGGSLRLFWPDSGGATTTTGATGASPAASPSAAPSIQAVVASVAPKPSNPNLDSCLMGTWRSVSVQVVNHFEGVDAVFTSKGGVIMRIQPDGSTTEDYNKSAPLTAKIKGASYVETLRGVRKSHVETRGGKVYGSGFSGGPTYKMKRNGKNQSIKVTNPTTSYTLPYICSESRLTVYGDDNSSTDIYERVN